MDWKTELNINIEKDKYELNILEENFKPIRQRIEQLKRQIEDNNKMLGVVLNDILPYPKW